MVVSGDLYFSVCGSVVCGFQYVFFFLVGVYC